MLAATVALLARLERWGRLTVYFTCLAIVCLGTECVGRLWVMLPTRPGSAARVRRANRVTRAWHATLTELTLRVLGCRLEVRGQVPPQRCIIVSNHQSTADIAILPWALRGLNVKFVAKEQLGRGIPTVSMALQSWGSALISRDGTREDIVRIKTMARGLASWQASVVIFPEGTRSRSGVLLPYKSAGVRLVASETDLPLLPVVIDGTHVAPDLVEFARRMPGARGTLTIGDPVPPEVWRGRLDEAVQDIRAWAEAVIEQGRLDGSVPPPVGWSPGAAGRVQASGGVVVPAPVEDAGWQAQLR